MRLLRLERSRTDRDLFQIRRSPAAKHSRHAVYRMDFADRREAQGHRLHLESTVAQIERISKQLALGRGRLAPDVAKSPDLAIHFARLFLPYLPKPWQIKRPSCGTSRATAKGHEDKN